MELGLNIAPRKININRVSVIWSLKCIRRYDALKKNVHCFIKSLCGMQTEEEQQMELSEIVAQPASESPSTSQVLGPHKGVKPFLGNFYHFTVSREYVNGRIKWKQHIWTDSMTKGEEVGRLLYEYDSLERTAGAVRKISLVQVQILNIKLLLKGVFNETSLTIASQ